MGPTNKKLIFLWLSPSPPYSLLGCRLASRDKQNSWFKILANLQRRREYGGEGDNQRKISFLFVGPISSYLDYTKTNTAYKLWSSHSISRSYAETQSCLPVNNKNHKMRMGSKNQGARFKIHKSKRISARRRWKSSKFIKSHRKMNKYFIGSELRFTMWIQIQAGVWHSLIWHFKIHMTLKV